MIAAQYITLSELQRRVRQALEERFALPLWVSAEIAEVKVNYSGHCYLELVEKGEGDGVPKAQARAVIWRSQYARIAAYFEAETGQRLAAGMRILAKATVNYHELYGFSLQLLDVDPAYTLGDMERQRQQTIARLQAEGVWEMNRQQAMPAVVQRIAVVSSSRAAGYQDFCNELAKSPYRFCLTLFDAVVQGAAAEDSIVDALSRIAAAGEAFDAVVMIRGGGSSSDLNCFNAYRLCNHVAQFPATGGDGHRARQGYERRRSGGAYGAQNADGRGGVARRTDGAGRRLSGVGRIAVGKCGAGDHAFGGGRTGTARRGSRTAEPAVVAGGAEPASTGRKRRCSRLRPICCAGTTAGSRPLRSCC